MSSERDVVLDMSYGGLGSLLRETVRANLHSSNPSAFVGNIMEGVRKYRQEVVHTESSEDRQLLCEVEHRLLILRDVLRHMEDNLFPPTP